MINEKIIIIIWGVFLVILGFLIIFSLVGYISNNKFCEIVYPSEFKYKINGGYSTIDRIQLGYVKCCRVIYEDHQKQYECEIFKH